MRYERNFDICNNCNNSKKNYHNVPFCAKSEKKFRGEGYRSTGQSSAGTRGCPPIAKSCLHACPPSTDNWKDKVMFFLGRFVSQQDYWTRYRAIFGKFLRVVCKGKGKGLDTCYSATYMSQTRDQQRFTISEVAADWHELLVSQCIMWPSIARANGQLVS